MKYLLLFLLIFTQPVYALNINESIKSTIINNIKVKNAYEKLNESKEIIENSYGKKLPSITTSISGTYSKSETETSNVTTTPESFTDKYKITLTQNIYDGGVNNLEIDRSNLLYEIEIIRFKNTIQNLILRAIEGYLTVTNYSKSLDANKKNYDSVQKFLEETKTKYDIGSATLFDLQNAESAFALAETNLFVAEENYNISKKTFKRIVSLEANNLEEIANLDEKIKLKQVIDTVQKQNLDLLILGLEISNNEILLSKEKNSKLPSLDLSASAEYSDTGRIDPGSKKTDGSISLTLTIPIFQQNIDNSNIRKYHSKILQSEYNFEDYKSDLEIQALNLFKDYEISRSNIQTNLKRIKSIETSLDIIKSEYALGTKSITDIIDAESELLSVNVNYHNSKKDFILNYFQIKALQGTLVEMFENYLPEFN